MLVTPIRYNVRVRYISNYMKMNVNKTSHFLVYGRKTSWHEYDDKLCKSSIACTDCNRDLSSAYRYKASFSPTCRHILLDCRG